jgi:hypothetical protein
MTPSIYKPEFCVIVVEKMQLGWSQIEVASHIGICKWTWYSWKKKNSDFKEAVELGLTHAEALWQKLGRENLYNPNFNAALWYMNMRNRFDWSNNPADRIVKRDAGQLLDCKSLIEEIKLIEKWKDDGEISDAVYVELVKATKTKSEIYFVENVIPRLKAIEEKFEAKQLTQQ